MEVSDSFSFFFFWPSCVFASFNLLLCVIAPGVSSEFIGYCFGMPWLWTLTGLQPAISEYIAAEEWLLNSLWCSSFLGTQLWRTNLSIYFLLSFDSSIKLNVLKNKNFCLIRREKLTIQTRNKNIHSPDFKSPPTPASHGLRIEVDNQREEVLARRHPFYLSHWRPHAP